MKLPNKNDPPKIPINSPTAFRIDRALKCSDSYSWIDLKYREK